MDLRKLFQRFRQWLIRHVLAYHIRDKERGGWLYLYGRELTLIFLLSVLTFVVVLHYQPVPQQYLAFFTLPFLFVALGLNILFVARFLKLTGKQGLLFIVILAAILAAIKIFQIWLKPP